MMPHSYPDYASRWSRSTPRIGAIVVALAVTGAALTACTSSADPAPSSSAGGDVSAEVQALAAAATADATWQGPTESPAIQSGKHIMIIASAMAAEGVNRMAKGFEEAAAEVGWTTELIDGQGDPKLQNAALAQALTTKPDGIYLDAVDPAVVKNRLAEVRAAGIPVISVSGEEDAEASATEHQVSERPREEADALAAWLTVDSGGAARIAAFEDDGFGSTRERHEEFMERIAEYCPGCEIVVTTKFAVTELGTTLGPKAKAVLQSNPDVDYVYVDYDPAAAPIVQALAQAGFTDKVKLVAFNGDAQNLSFIREGRIQVATAAESMEWIGWASVDNMNRVLAGEAPVDSDNIGIKVIDATNVPDSGVWDGDVDFRSEYRSLWGIG